MQDGWMKDRRTLSLDIRERILARYDEGESTRAEVAVRQTLPRQRPRKLGDGGVRRGSCMVGGMVAVEAGAAMTPRQARMPSEKF